MRRNRVSYVKNSLLHASLDEGITENGLATAIFETLTLNETSKLNMMTFLEWVLIGVAALAAVLLFYQHAQMRRAFKAEIGHRLFETFFTSSELSSFRVAIGTACYNEVLKRDILQALQTPEDYDLEGYRHRAELYSAFLRHVFYNIEKGLIEPEQVNSIIGIWIIEYYTFKEHIIAQHGFPIDYVPAYFPGIPHALMQVLAPALRQAPALVSKSYPQRTKSPSRGATRRLEQQFVEGKQTKPFDEGQNILSAEEFEAFADELADELAAHLDPNTPPLSDYAVSRTGIYEDHP